MGCLTHSDQYIFERKTRHYLLLFCLYARSPVVSCLLAAVLVGLSSEVLTEFAVCAVVDLKVDNVENFGSDKTFCFNWPFSNIASLFSFIFVGIAFMKRRFLLRM